MSQGLKMEYLMLRGIFMSPGATPEQVNYYVEVFKKVRETPEWTKLMVDGAFNQTFMTGDEYAKWVGQGRTASPRAHEGSRFPRQVTDRRSSAGGAIRRRRKRPWRLSEMSEQSHMAETGPSQRSVEIAVALSTLAFEIIVLLGSLQVGIGWGVEGPKPGFFPFYVSLFIIVASIYNLLQATTLGGIKQGLFSSLEQLRRVMSVVVPATIYVALVPFLGIYVSSILLIAVFMMWLGRYSAWKTLPIAVGVPAIVYIVFERYFQIALPKGPVEYWLGL